MTPPLLDMLSSDCQSVPSYKSLDPTVINEDNLHLTDILTETLWESIVFYKGGKFLKKLWCCVGGSSFR